MTFVHAASGYYDRRRGLEPPKYVPAPGMYGLGLVLGGVAACFGVECGATRAQLLAIFDNEKQHKTLVRYYKTLGFKPLREVGDGLESLGDRLVTIFSSFFKKIPGRLHLS